MLTLWVCRPIQLRGEGGVRVGGLEPLTSRTMPFSVTYLCLSLTAILLVFCFSFLFVFLMNKLLLSYLLYPFAQLARAENTIIFFRLPFGWFFMKTLFLQFFCLFVLHELYVCNVCKIMRSWCIARVNHAETKRYLRSRVHMKHHPNGNLKNSMVFSALPNHLSSCPSVLPVVKFGNASVKLNSTCAQTPPPPPGWPPGISTFLPWMANSRGWGLLSCQIPRGGDEKRGPMPRPPSTLQHFSLWSHSQVVPF